MDGSKTALERAFELARTGQYLNITELRGALHKEGYPGAQLDGPALGRQLRAIMLKSQVDRAPTVSA